MMNFKLALLICFYLCLAVARGADAARNAQEMLENIRALHGHLQDLQTMVGVTSDMLGESPDVSAPPAYASLRDRYNEVKDELDERAKNHLGLIFSMPQNQSPRSVIMEDAIQRMTDEELDEAIDEMNEDGEKYMDPRERQSPEFKRFLANTALVRNGVEFDVHPLLWSNAVYAEFLLRKNPPSEMFSRYGRGKQLKTILMAKESDDAFRQWVEVHTKPQKFAEWDAMTKRCGMENDHLPKGRAYETALVIAIHRGDWDSYDKLVKDGASYSADFIRHINEAVELRKQVNILLIS